MNKCTICYTPNDNEFSKVLFNLDKESSKKECIENCNTYRCKCGNMQYKQKNKYIKGHNPLCNEYHETIHCSCGNGLFKGYCPTCRHEHFRTAFIFCDDNGDKIILDK